MTKPVRRTGQGKCGWRVRAKVRHLLELGTGKRRAILIALSRKDYWHLARTLATQTEMTNRWLASQGLLSVRDLWISSFGVQKSTSFPLRPHSYSNRRVNASN